MEPDDWQAFKTLRLSGLKESPDAFGSTYEQALKNDDAHWQNRLKTVNPREDLPLFACAGDRPIGLAWGKIFEPGEAHLFQMYVAPEFRGKGAGAQLLQAAIDWARGQGCVHLLLSVTIDDSPAWHMYKRAGFTASGPPEPLREGSTIQAQPLELTL